MADLSKYVRMSLDEKAAEDLNGNWAIVVGVNLGKLCEPPESRPWVKNSHCTDYMPRSRPAPGSRYMELLTLLDIHIK